MTERRGPYRTGIETRRALVENAVKVFGEHGFRGGSVRMIAESVGSTASQITNHFGSKHGLLTAVLEHWDAQQVTSDALHGLDSVNALRTRMAYSRDNPAWVEFLLTLASEATAMDHPAHAYFVDRYARIAEGLQSHILEAARSGAIAPISPAAALEEAQRLSAMMDGLQLQWMLDRRIDLVAVFDDYLDAVIDGWRRPARPVDRTAVPDDPRPHDRRSSS